MKNTHGYHVFPLTMTTGVSQINAVDLGEAWNHIRLYMGGAPAMADAAYFLYMNAKSTSTGTFRRVMFGKAAVAVTIDQWALTEAETDGIFTMPVGFRYVQLEFSTAVCAPTNVFYLICSNSGESW